MKALIWFAFLLLAAFWTGMVMLTGQVTDWVLGSMQSGQINDLAATAGQVPLPAWLALWVDTAWLKEMQTLGVSLVQWLGQVLPSADGLMTWINPLLWFGWGLGMLVMLIGAVAAHWLLGKGQGVSSALRTASLARRT
jgi:hypothetical protein